MEYRIEKRDAFQVVCRRKRVAKPQAANATADITAMWQACGADGTMEKLLACMPEKPVMKGLLGICFSAELDGAQFPYGIGVEYDGRKISGDLEVVTSSMVHASMPGSATVKRVGGTPMSRLTRYPTSAAVRHGSSPA